MARSTGEAADAGATKRPYWLADAESARGFAGLSLARSGTNGAIEPGAGDGEFIYRRKIMGIPLRALIVEDSENDCPLLVRTLSKGGYEVRYRRVDTPTELLANLESEEWDIV